MLMLGPPSSPVGLDEPGVMLASVAARVAAAAAIASSADEVLSRLEAGAPADSPK